MIRLYNYTDHMDASRMRDLGTDCPVQKTEQADRQLLAQAARTGSFGTEEEDPFQLLENQAEPDSIAVREVGGYKYAM